GVRAGDRAAADEELAQPLLERQGPERGVGDRLEPANGFFGSPGCGPGLSRALRPDQDRRTGGCGFPLLEDSTTIDKARARSVVVPTREGAESPTTDAAPALPRSRVGPPVPADPIVLMPVPRLPHRRGEPAGAEDVQVALPRHDGYVQPPVAVEVGHRGRQ